MKKYVIIVAGGKGIRMSSDLPKQFLILGEKPILMHTIQRFAEYDPTIKIILVLPQDQQDYWKGLCRQYDFMVPHKIANGGDTRFQSVKNGLAFIRERGLVGIHDGVRPFVTTEVIDRCYKTAETAGAVIPVIDIVETVREVLPEGSRSVNRNLYKIVQTPQVFQNDLLLRAYNQLYREEYTDDATVVESCDIKVTLVEGNRENIKITTPFDLMLGEEILEKEK
ncbi:MAG: 2-C-methyl-D-erythritol 4-phosphate cytidylyltransferase [Bacteroidales bacterium]|jgi:2-C-methyl-D-erythritol 4-phosphate cytidylyltransferase|nr:2-C-methyl-D-erythritol 4-phosphate cytidylyltransferase [Bacteroidales bacterium]